MQKVFSANILEANGIKSFHQKNNRNNGKVFNELRIYKMNEHTHTHTNQLKIDIMNQQDCHSATEDAAIAATTTMQ